MKRYSYRTKAFEDRVQKTRGIGAHIHKYWYKPKGPGKKRHTHKIGELNICWYEESSYNASSVPSHHKGRKTTHPRSPFH